MLNNFYNRREEENRKPMSHEKFLYLCKTNFKLALQYNKIWRGAIIPHIPITKNIFCLTDKIYDIQKLVQDLKNITKNTKTGWETKSKGKIKLFDWTSITLKGYQGNLQPFLEKHELMDQNGKNTFKYTENMLYCSYIREIFEEIEAGGSEIYLVRLLKLIPKKFIGWHTDDEVFKNKMNIIRCHLPIITNPQCLMFLGYPTDLIRPCVNLSQRYKTNQLWDKHLEAGKIWYTNVNCLHAVENKGDADRVHLVFDIKPTQEMLKKIYR